MKIVGFILVSCVPGVRADPFQGQVATVSGGASGIGRALCEELARGARFMFADIDDARVLEVVKRILHTCAVAEAICLDVSSKDEIKRRQCGRDEVCKKAVSASELSKSKTFFSDRVEANETVVVTSKSGRIFQKARSLIPDDALRCSSVGAFHPTSGSFQAAISHYLSGLDRYRWKEVCRISCSSCRAEKAERVALEKSLLDYVLSL